MFYIYILYSPGYDHYYIGHTDDVIRIKEQPLHPKNTDIGTKRVFYYYKILIDTEDANILELGEEFTLVNWGNAIVKSKDEDNKTMDIELHLEGDYKTTKNKITWIKHSAKMNNSPLLKITLVFIGDLITVPSLPKNNKHDNKEVVDWKKFINPNLKKKVVCYGEDAFASGIVKGQKLQIMRKGYFIVHDSNDKDGLVLVEIPDGKTK